MYIPLLRYFSTNGNETLKLMSNTYEQNRIYLNRLACHKLPNIEYLRVILKKCLYLVFL